ncbi:MAG: hypothetical protein COZ46_01260 [Verrucomicrobia bacterium CG_4_10_14_3_um_filter_43_23]|nr:MAG: hypothetical protein AUJ82_01295 [Verrucomicrobia bacterium CG1_02_43_26]PIP59532.1 MAG: hypothetical protein COX01_02865 [Verrucomicrobia bacterium CG22_combo_CG10-13_8_21_14_all_43_17]PIX58833.1 MAG: hypothetical protein COZ46_01260 [Verrucomicrobia bacterium CG_4_10_14_3_um_filter_43_23]PIY60928.1 MAG: hypothetical protein COY94_07940 [Verrucomicrobia bacterium CG_4_10_14_0_8_um_filter_43_34]PJA44842.1 MAG: hypothetical protein CO175_00750 [Verrucomicrobia bacterium CG_4_9_14_3_um_fi
MTEKTPEDEIDEVLAEIDKMISDIDISLKQGEKGRNQTCASLGITEEELDQYPKLKDCSREFQDKVKNVINESAHHLTKGGKIESPFEENAKRANIGVSKRGVKI